MTRPTIRGSVVAALVGFAACAAPAPIPRQAPAPSTSTTASSGATPQPPSAKAPVLHHADSPRTLPGGSTFTAPAGFTVTVDGPVTLVDPPESDSHAAVVVTTGASVDAAVDNAWRAFRPTFGRPVKERTRLPARFGWQERRVVVYETSPNEAATVYAYALRNAGSWTVLLVEASRATFEKRLSPFMLIEQSLRPMGYAPETFAGKKANPLDVDRVQRLSTFVQHAMDELGVPGAALGLIEGGRLILARGFGVQELGKPARVDADTLFMIASNTKALTTLLLAKLVDEGKFGWDTPATQVHSEFRVGDEETTHRILMKHMACACTGMPDVDAQMLFEFGRRAPRSIFEVLATTRPTTPFGEVFQYSNLMVAAAGYVGARSLYPGKEVGAAYDQAMQTKVFDPLGMKTATFDFDHAERTQHASPHGNNVSGKPAVASSAVLRYIRPDRPAGGAWASVRDLAQYVQLELGKGSLPDGTRCVSQRNLLERRVQQIATGENAGYGMGLGLWRAWGVPVVFHDGALRGFRSTFFFLPEHGSGVVLLTNSATAEPLIQQMPRRFLEVVFDGAPEADEDLAADVLRMRSQETAQRARLTVPADAAIVARLATRYKSASLGELQIKKRGAATVLDVGEWGTEVATRSNDDGTVSLIGIDPRLNEEFIVGERQGKRVLVYREQQQEHLFIEVQ